MRYIIIILLFLFACSEEKESLDLDATQIKIEPGDSSAVFLEDIADTSYQLKLKPQKDFVIKHVSKLFITDSLIIIADRAQSAILIFDSFGNPKTKILHWGGKMGQYANMTDVIFDSKKNQIEVLDLSIEKILVYDVIGNFVKSMDIIGAKNFGLTFAKVNDTYASQMLNNNNNRNMHRLGLFKEETNAVTHQSQNLIYYPLIQNLDLSYWHQFDIYNDSLFYFPLLDDKIYQLSLKGAKPIYQVAVPKDNRIGFTIKSHKPVKDHFEYWKEMESANIMYDNQSLFITKDWVSFRYFFQSNNLPRDVFYSKKSRKVIQFSTLKSKANDRFKSQTGIMAKKGDFFVTFAPISESENSKMNDSIESYGLPIVFLFFKLKDI